MSKKKRIIFKYHPNLYDSGVVNYSKGICECCGDQIDEFIDSMYSTRKVNCICLKCVHNGEAAKKFNGTFIQDAMCLNDEEKKEELFCRTPGYISWQGEYWLTCCDDYCAFVGNVGTSELERLGIADEIIDEYEKKGEYNNIRHTLSKDGAMCGYLFKCLHCGQYHLWVDAD